MTAFSHFYNPQRSRATPAAAKMLRPRPEPKSTISGWTLEIIFFWHAVGGNNKKVVIKCFLYAKIMP